MTGSAVWRRAPIWDQWRRLTKFMGSARIAFADAESANAGTAPDTVRRFELGDGRSAYKTTIRDYVAAAGDLHQLHALVLLGSYALTESHCRLISRIAASGNWKTVDAKLPNPILAEAENIELAGGIEDWSAKLMTATGQSWASVYGGCAGLVEVSIIRNLVAHGRSSVGSADIENARRRGTKLPFAAGDDVRLDYALLNVYRGRLRSFCRCLSDGAVHLARGTHRDAR